MGRDSVQYMLNFNFCALHMSLLYSDSRNNVPRVGRRYGTMAAHTRCLASVRLRCVYSVFA